MPSNVYTRPGGRFGARITVAGRQVPLGTYDTEELAQRVVDRAKGGRLPERTTILEWSKTWQDLFPGKRSSESRQHNDHMVAPFVRLHGSKKPADITLELAQSWAVASPGSVRYLKLMFAKAKKIGLVDHNVWADVEVDVDSEPRIPPTPGELVRLHGAALELGGFFGDQFADLLIFDAHSGLRLSEIASLRLCDVVAPNRVKVWDEKKDRYKLVGVYGPGVEALRRALLRRREQLGLPFGVPSERLIFQTVTRRPWTRGTMSRVYRKLCSEAEVSGTFHGLRHFCATWLLDQGATDRDVAIQLGHLDAAGHANTEHVRETYGHPTVEPALGRLTEITTKEGSDGGEAPADRREDDARPDGSHGGPGEARSELHPGVRRLVPGDAARRPATEPRAHAPEAGGALS